MLLSGLYEHIFSCNRQTVLLYASFGSNLANTHSRPSSHKRENMAGLKCLILRYSVNG